MFFSDCDESYTKCHECGRWDDEHIPACVTGVRADYIAGRIEVEEFERKLGKLLALEAA